jgi:fatty acid desaturase
MAWNGHAWGAFLFPACEWLYGAALMHDCSHFAAFANGRLNRLCCAFGGWPVITNSSTWTIQHVIQHHQFTNMLDDVDLFHFMPLVRVSRLLPNESHHRWNTLLILLLLPTTTLHLNFAVPMDIVLGTKVFMGPFNKSVPDVDKVKLRYYQCKHLPKLLEAILHPIVLEVLPLILFYASFFYFLGTAKGMIFFVVAITGSSWWFIVFTQGSHLREDCMTNVERNVNKDPILDEGKIYGFADQEDSSAPKTLDGTARKQTKREKKLQKLALQNEIESREKIGHEADLAGTVIPPAEGPAAEFAAAMITAKPQGGSLAPSPHMEEPLVPDTYFPVQVLLSNAMYHWKGDRLDKEIKRHQLGGFGAKSSTKKSGDDTSPAVSANLSSDNAEPGSASDSDRDQQKLKRDLIDLDNDDSPIDELRGSSRYAKSLGATCSTSASVVASAAVSSSSGGASDCSAPPFLDGEYSTYGLLGEKEDCGSRADNEMSDGEEDDMDDSTEEDAPVNPQVNAWVQEQVAYTADFCTTSRFWSFISGGLNMQTLHHCMPVISQSHYHEMYPKFLEVMKKHGIKVQRVDSFSQFAWDFCDWVRLCGLPDENPDSSVYLEVKKEQ